MPERIVEKFGGTSMACPEVVASRIEERLGDVQQLIVVSAPGICEARNINERTTPTLNKYFGYVKEGDEVQIRVLRDTVIDRFDTIYYCLGTTERREMRDVVASILTPSRKDDKAYYEHLGERLSAQYLSRFIGARCLDPAIKFFGNGRLDRAKTLESIRRQMAEITDDVIIPGYFGMDEFGRVCLLGPGGSDRTAAFYPKALECDYENWTDVDGIYSADPKIVKEEAQLISELSRPEVREGAHGGTGVLAGKTLADLEGSDVVTTVKNTFNPSAPGTRVVRSREVDPNSPPIVALSGRDDLYEISIRDMGMADEPGYGAKLLNEFTRLGLSWQNMPTAADYMSITLVLEKGAEERAKQEIAISEFADFARKNCIGEESNVEVSEKGIVYAVGERLRDPRERSMAIIRLMGDIVCAGYDAEEPISSRLSPSLAFLVQPEAVNPIIQAIHAREIAHRTKLT